MKKCILIGALAALTLFAFTACDNQVSITGTPVGMTATVSKTNYLVGQEIDLSTISATVDFSGNVSKTFSGNEIAFVGNTAATAPGTNPLEVQSGANQLTFAYGSVNSQGDISGAMAMVTVYGYKAKTVTLNNMPTTVAKTNSDGTISLDTSAVTATVVDEKGNSYEVAADDVEVTASVAGKAGTQAVSISSVFVYGEEATAATTKTGFNVTVSDQTTTSAVNGLLVRWEKADGTVVETPYVDQLTGADAVTLKVYTTIDGVASKTALKTGEYKVYGSVDTLPATGKLPVQEDAVEITIVYVADPSVTTSYRYYGVDYAKDLVVTLKSTTDVAQGASVSTVIEKVEVEYASGEKEAVTDYDLSLSTVDTDQKLGTVTVYAYLENAGKNGTTLIKPFDINVVKGAN